MTSANAARHAGDQLRLFTSLPCYAVGEATAAAARSAGFARVHSGPKEGAALATLAAEAGARRPLHLTGRDHRPLDHPSLTVERRIVYAAEPVSALPPEAAATILQGTTALLHSPRAGALFGRLVDQAGLDRRCVKIAAISEAAATAAGAGWKSIFAADRPRDDALLELAAKLCQIEGCEAGNGG